MSLPRFDFFRLFLGTLLVAALGLAIGGCLKYPDCKNDGHCQKYIDKGIEGAENTPFCVNQTCNECRDNNDCEVWEQCNRGTCADIPGYCDDERPCPEPQVCRNNRCGPECLTNDDCTEGDFPYCDGGRCQEGQCYTDEDCEEGFRCENYMCRPMPDNSPCNNDEFRPVPFDFDESTLTRSGRDVLEGWNSACISRNPGRAFLVEGHCDERGTEEYNLALGDRRARTVRDFFRDMDVDNSLIRTISYGESRPVNPRSNESAWRENRRAEIKWDD